MYSRSPVSGRPEIRDQGSQALERWSSPPLGAEGSLEQPEHTPTAWHCRHVYNPPVFPCSLTPIHPSTFRPSIIFSFHSALLLLLPESGRGALPTLCFSAPEQTARVCLLLSLPHESIQGWYQMGS